MKMFVFLCDVYHLATCGNTTELGKKLL